MTCTGSILAAVDVFDFVLRHLGWFLAGAILLVGLVVGAGDLARLSLRRVWAISGVNFSESMRRRVLWVTPLAMLGVLAVAQFQRSIDEQDAIRQATKACVFATGLVVVVTTIILACTNLPREIDSRVIYTIVTKPTTRLEIVLGKIVGFARVSGTILLVMGIFTLGYLYLREWQMVRGIKSRLAAGQVDTVSKPALQFYAAKGLLGTKSVEAPDSVSVVARPPQKGELPRLRGGEQQMFVTTFELTADQKTQIVDAVNAGAGLFVINTLPYEQREPTAAEARQIRESGLLPAKPAAPAVEGPAKPGGGRPKEADKPAVPVPQVTVQVMDRNRYVIISSESINQGKYVDLKRPAADQPGIAAVPLTNEQTNALLEAGRFMVGVFGITPAVEYLVPPTPTVVAAIGPDGKTLAMIEPVRGDEAEGQDPNAPAPPELVSAYGRWGMQLRGDKSGEGSVALYHFGGADVPAADGEGKVTFEVRIGIEGSSRDFETEEDVVARMTVQVRNNVTGETSEPVTITPEHNRANYIRVPASFVEGGNFDVLVRGLTPDQWFGMQPGGVALVTADRSFVVNLVKSLLILWLLAVLVVVVSIFCSTFLSWPVAVVLTLVILLGQWGVQQVEAGGGPGIGASVTQAMGLDDPTTAKIVRSSVEFLDSLLVFVSAFLPDIASFAATEDIERGVSIPPAKILDATGVLFGYGVPLAVLTYVILKRKEVAP